jgi:hypothetical protein
MNTTKSQRLALADALIQRGYDPHTSKTTPGILADYAAETGVAVRTLQRAMTEWRARQAAISPRAAQGSFWDALPAVMLQANRGLSAHPPRYAMGAAVGSRRDWFIHRALCSPWQALFLPLVPYGRAWVADRLRVPLADRASPAPDARRVHPVRRTAVYRPTSNPVAYRRITNYPLAVPGATDRLMRLALDLETARTMRDREQERAGVWTDRRSVVTVADMRRVARTLVPSVHLTLCSDGFLRKKLVSTVQRFMSGSASHYREPFSRGADWRPVRGREWDAVLRSEAVEWRDYDRAVRAAEPIR